MSVVVDVVAAAAAAAAACSARRVDKSVFAVVACSVTVEDVALGEVCCTGVSSVSAGVTYESPGRPLLRTSAFCNVPGWYVEGIVGVVEPPRGDVGCIVCVVCVVGCRVDGWAERNLARARCAEVTRLDDVVRPDPDLTVVEVCCVGRRNAVCNVAVLDDRDDEGRVRRVGRAPKSVSSPISSPFCRVTRGFVASPHPKAVGLVGILGFNDASRTDCTPHSQCRVAWFCA